MDTPFKLTATLLSQLPLSEAVEIEVNRRPDLLPRDIVDAAVQADPNGFIVKLRGLVEHGYEPPLSEIILGRKPLGGSRPVPILGMIERVLVRAFGIRLMEACPQGIPGTCSYEEMTEGPLAEASPFVVIGDVTAFFQYVDHDLLQTELVSLTGDIAGSRASVELLSRIMGRRSGLPQGHRSSDFFADIYIDIAERNLMRRGRKVWRYLDDLRFEASSLSDAQRCIDEVSEELYRIGLVLNVDKTYPRTLAEYQEDSRRAEHFLEELAGELAEFLGHWNPYTDEFIPPGEGEVLTAAASEAIRAWSEKAAGRPKENLGALGYANRKILVGALTILTEYSDPAGLSYCLHILNHEPQQSDKVLSYIGSLMESEQNLAIHTLEGIVSSESLYLNEWQQLWLVEALSTASDCGQTIADWLHAIYNSRSTQGMLRAAAGSVLLRFGELANSDLVGLIKTLPVAARPRIIAALVEHGSGIDRFVRRAVIDSFLDEIVLSHCESLLK